MLKPAWTNHGRTGPVRDYIDLKVFACEGLIVVIDERPGQTEGEYVVVLPSDMEARIKELNRPGRRESRANMTPAQKETYDRRKRGFQECAEAIREARAMGDPSSPAVQLFWARHRRSSTVRIRFSPGADAAGYPEFPALPRGRDTGRTARIDAEAVVPPNLHSLEFTHLHKAPKKKNRAGLILLD